MLPPGQRLTVDVTTSTIVIHLCWYRQIVFMTQVVLVALLLVMWYFRTVNKIWSVSKKSTAFSNFYGNYIKATLSVRVCVC